MKDRSMKPRARGPADSAERAGAAAPDLPGADDDPRQAPVQEHREREALEQLRRKRGRGARADPNRGRAR
jgi:hypothetical protein